MYHRLIDFLASGFYSGHAPLAPGTAGSLAYCLLYFTACRLYPGLTEVSWQIALVLFFTLLGIYVSNEALRLGVYGDTKKDPGQIVIDEFAGQATALIGFQGELLTLIAAFALFRFFDVLKIYPVSRLETLPSGWGIMLDDVAAGGYALACLWGLQYFIF